MKKSLKALPLVAVAGLGLSVVVPTMAQEGPINVISREDGSGTRGAFVEIVGVVDEDDNDLTTQNATVQNQTSGVMQTVAGDPSAIGYISLGSLDESVKAVKVDGSDATPEAIKAGDYPIARPFNVAWSAEKELSEVASDFLTFIHSEEGQAVVEEEGYISVTPAGEELDEATDEEETEEAAEEMEETEEEMEETEEAAEGEEESELAPYEATAELEGTVEVVGSTSVSPLMEKLAEAYKEFQPNVEINITSNGSSAGMEAAMNDTADLGMASRELKDEELEVLEHDAIAIDGIAVVVNNENPAEEMTLEAIRGIFLGEISTWEDAVK
ncbi:substrate-binding domain-containing protein [Facklamia sp. 7083-14-GEN3]|uniref:substrate-binding domain-containing protein n=1 Tax=Facklamia sp. 7083-14-GEN3 TaxID=2973478 RepID=UPI00215BACA9|nr:substrate-binding domain-containing protein [Facklamia sp. 7083-14-GEN3]MCR8970003.1 substrate-binding domain-containing protein [Facklamia sp. 7083-14-GEN3]